MKRLARYFVEGLLFLTPLVVSVYAVYLLFVRVDRMFGFSIPGTGVLFTLLIIMFTGFFASNFLTRWLTRLIDRLFARLPLVKMIYTAVKDLVSAFVGDKKAFRAPVSVLLDDRSGISVAGFMTAEDLSHLGLSDRVAVYLPQSYNFAGNLIMVPRQKVTPIKADSGDVMAFVVSGGVSG